MSSDRVTHPAEGPGLRRAEGEEPRSPLLRPMGWRSDPAGGQETCASKSSAEEVEEQLRLLVPKSGLFVTPGSPSRSLTPSLP
ncbi:hypothetical protein JOB18_016876 [Solea senegalensis]|uniref:Uncharacterized protein n=1 Tax=Solea senegalensis TaxID=28829 RepID=A0AAV6SGM7_SOLSE|nr:hypothetical protein JOB18_016876 [Solea senegalensis]